MSPEAIVGVLVTAGIAIIGFVINGYRARIADNEAEIKKLREELKEIREKYVRRDDLNGHLIAVAKSIDELKDDLKNIAEKLTALFLRGMAERDK